MKTTTILFHPLLLLVLFTVSGISLTAQDLRTARTSSHYTYIFKISSEQLETFYKNADPFDKMEKQLTIPVDSFLTDSGFKKELAAGAYVYIRANDNNLEYSITCVNTYDVCLYSNKHDLTLIVYDRISGQPISNAELNLRGKTIAYDSVAKAYILPGAKRTGLLSVHLNDEASFYWVQGTYEFSSFRRKVKYQSGQVWKRIRVPLAHFFYRLRYAGPSQDLVKTSYRYNYEPRYTGYIAFNKPKYLPKDTVKVKAFFLKGKTKPVEHDMKALVCKKGDPYHARQVAWMHPASKGAYTCEFVLGDTLPLNTWYTLIFQDKKNHNYIMSRDLLLEDYELNATTYKLRNEEREIKKGEPMRFFASGKDANGLSLLDARVKLTIKVRSIDRFIADSLLIPDQLWQTEQKLDPLGETTISVPDSILPLAKLQLLIEATFNNSNNETHDTSFVITYNGLDKYTRVRTEGGLIKADHVEKGKVIPAQGVLLKHKANSIVDKKTISFPYSEKLDPLTRQYVFSKDLVSETFQVSDEDPLVTCYASRTTDSVLISLVNPRQLPIEYSIYKNGRTEIEKGTCLQLEKMLEDKTGCPYQFSYHYIWGGEVKDVHRSILLFKNDLTIDIDQPSKIYPGQKTKVKIRVTDADNEPVQDVNITAGALNNQFGDARVPTVPYLGKLVSAVEGANNFTLSRENFAGSKLLPERWRNKMRLDTMLYYQFTYPANGIKYNYDSVAINNAQVAPFLYADGAQIPVYLAYIDHRPVYWYGATNADQYVFSALPGYHTITLRSYDKIYTIDSVLLKTGHKLDLSLDTAHVPARINVGKISSSFTPHEKSLICSSTLYLNKSYFYESDASVWQGDKVFLFSDYRSLHSAKVFGFLRDSINYYKSDDFKTTFMFEPGYDYTLYRKLIKMRSLIFTEESGYLSETVPHKALGLLARTLPPRPVKKFNSLSKFHTVNPSTTREGNGRYEFNYTGDSLISLIRVTKQDGQGYFVEGYARQVRDLEPGKYSFTLITPGHYFLTRRGIVIKANAVTFERFGDVNYEKGDGKYLLSWDTLISTQAYAPTHLIADENYYSFTMSNDLKSGRGILKITVTDKKTKEAIPFAAAILLKNGLQVAGGQADFDGNIIFKPLPAGVFDVKIVYAGYQSRQIERVRILDDKPSYLNVSLESQGVDLDEVMVVEYKVPLIDADTKSGGVVNRESFMHMADKSINSVVSTQAGVYQQDIGNDIYIRGARPGGNVYFVDGERMIGTSGLPAQYDYKPLTVYENLSPEANQVRSKFSDYAYWQPNLITDAKGEASFEVTFPQNVTSWKAYALAMDSKKHSGVGIKETRAFIEIMANLAVPRFLVMGDSAFAIGKVLNYTSSAPNVTSQLKINGKLMFTRDTVLRTALIEPLLLNPLSTDSFKVSYSSALPGGAKDGEERTIPIMPIGTEETYGDLYTLNGDTDITISLPEGENKIYAIDNSLDLMLKEIESLKNYPYWCMEQTASKLNALLIEKHIRKALHQDFNEENTIHRLLKKLEKGQKENGSWGWWEDSPENAWMSAYISLVITKAVKDGYTFKTKDKALQYLAWAMHTLKGNELLVVLNTLSEMKFAIPYHEYFKEIKKDSLTLYQKLLIVKICQENSLPYDLSIIEKEKKQTMMGNYYWGNESYDWYNNTIKNTLLVYKILETRNPSHPYLPSIRNYFIEIKKENKWRNTVESASILETILPALLQGSDNANQSTSLDISGAITVRTDSFPSSYKVIGDAKKINIHKKGTGPLYLTAYHKKWNEKPQPKNDSYEIVSYFQVQNKKVDSLTAGLPTEMIIEVTAKKSAEYIMLEVPIPAGCSYDDNKYNTNGLEVHREYFKNKTSIFCESMSIGKHIFKIKLQPRFSGSYTLNPARAELMYFPIFFGRNALTKVKIKN